MADSFGISQGDMDQYSQQYRELLNKMNRLNSTPIEHRGLKLIPKGSLSALTDQLRSIENPYAAYMQNQVNSEQMKRAAKADKLHLFQKGLLGLTGASVGLDVANKVTDISNKSGLTDKIKSWFASAAPTNYSDYTDYAPTNISGMNFSDYTDYAPDVLSMISDNDIDLMDVGSLFQDDALFTDWGGADDVSWGLM